ncbi:hypothetical protein TrCOL_g10959 [Triparma columacea]|uniref:Uncharacterized protein n=1 Tax=Triparma columacea TaxID=722753 RepID=A0A9W7G6D1_9STRA|nr:hypothetical protein TrCOL_g10959 [Triparma columacea]
MGWGRKGGSVKGGNGEYVAQAWPGEVRKVGISGDGRRVEVKGGFTVKEWNRVSKKERDGEEHVRPVIQAAGKGEGWTVAGVRRGEDCDLVVVEGERVKGVVRGKDARDVNVGRGRFVVGTKGGLEVWGYAGGEVKEFGIDEGGEGEGEGRVCVAIADYGTLVARSEGRFTSVWDDKGRCVEGWGGEGEVTKLEFAGGRLVETREGAVGARGVRGGGWGVEGSFRDSAVVGETCWR